MDIKLSKDEVFYSIQGEGKTIGSPAIFVRLATCNLGCKWCDTPYAVNPITLKKEMKVIDTKELIKMLVAKIKSTKCRRIVWTGGEPLLQQMAIENVIRLLDSELRNTFPTIIHEVETNGTIMPNDFLLRAINYFNVSPKLHSSGNKSTHKIINEDVLKVFNALPQTIFKFVIAEEDDDIREIDFLVNTFGLHKEKIWLMPLGVEKDDVLQSLPKLAKICLSRGWNLSSRLQILTWGNKRGV